MFGFYLEYASSARECVRRNNLTILLELRRLNPKPGNAYGSDPVSPVVPDVFVRAAPDGTWIYKAIAEGCKTLVATGSG